MYRILQSPADNLSPILEHGESIASPHPTAAMNAEVESPLPDLIIEQERYDYDDETEEFYNELEIKMKQLYKLLFLQEDSINEDVFNEIVPDYSDDEAVDDFEESDDVMLRADPGRDEDDHMANTNSGEDDLEPEKNQDADQATQTPESENRNLNESREETDVTDSEESLATSLESAEKSEPVLEKLAAIKGKIRLEENRSKIGDVCVVPSQTFTEKLDPSEDSSSTETRNESEQVTVQAILHKWKFVDDRELEVMRRRTMYSLEDSFTNLHKAAYNDRLDFNTHQCTTENENTEQDLNLGKYFIGSERSTINTSIPMEIDSFVHPSRVSSLFKEVPRSTMSSSPFNRVSPTRISSPFKEVSPVLACKRPATGLSSSIPTKKKNMCQKEQVIQQSETIVNSVASKETGTQKEIQVNIPETLLVANDDIQTDIQGGREVETAYTDRADAGTQVNRNPERTHSATQTDVITSNNAETQTGRTFEYFRLLDGINFIFFF